MQELAGQESPQEQLFPTEIGVLPKQSEQPEQGMPIVSPKQSEQPKQSKQSTPSPTQTSQQQQVDPNEPPLRLKGIGINFEDFKFTREKLPFNRIFMGYGFVIPNTMTDSGYDKRNPQPTFIVPLGTPVRSLVDGIVANVKTVWSGDYTIQVTQNGKIEKWVFETEHVLNPKVKVGDKVSAGQIIAEVSNFEKNNPAGYGTVEIGILKGGQVPVHVCPFAYLDESIKDDVLDNIKTLFKDWESFIGDQGLYDENLSIPGCSTLDLIEG